MDRTLLSVLAGLGGMFGWGTSDFLANNASERIGHTKTFFWSQVAGLGLTAILVLFSMPSFAMTPFFIALTIFGGIMYALGYLFFYKGFEIGNVSVVSAVINLQVIFVILISFFLRGQKLTLIQIPALILLLLGVLLVSVNFNDLKKGTVSLLKGVKETLIAALLFGVLYWPLNEYIVEKYDWLAVGLLTKLIAVIFVYILFSIRKQSIVVKGLNKNLIILISAVGILEAVGALSSNFGMAFGDGIIVAPISSALTLVTVGLAVVFLKEKLTKTQVVGIGMTVVGIIMTAF